MITVNGNFVARLQWKVEFRIQILEFKNEKELVIW